MTAHLDSGLLVSALVRRAAQDGGNAAVLARGDAARGNILLMIVEKGCQIGVLERLLEVDGRYRWQRVGPAANADDGYFDRRRMRDPDLWIVELDSPNAERFAAEMTGYD